MTRRIFRNCFAVGMGVLILCGALFMGILHQQFQQQMMEFLASESLLAARGVEHLGVAYLDGLDSECRFTLVSEDGSVLYDSVADPSTLENHADRVEIRDAMSNRSGTSIRYSSTLSQTTMYFARRLDDGSVLRLSSAQQTVIMRLIAMWQHILLILLVAVVLSGLLAARLSRRIIRPILALDPEHPENAEAYEELSPLLTRIKLQNATISQQMDQLRQKQREFTAITENMSEGFLLLDRQGRILSYNSGVLHLLQAQPPEEQASYLTLNRTEAFRHSVEDALNGKESQHLLSINKRCCQILSNPVREGTHLAGAVVVVLDVTEREQREELRREFTANVSHELRTPLTSISGIAEILKNGLVRSEDVKDFAADIYNEAQRLICLVQDIIHLSQLDEGGPSLDQQPVDLDLLALSVSQRLSSAARLAGIPIHVTGQPVQVTGIPAVLDEMVYNLCDNAIKYNRPGGSVTIHTQRTQRGAELSVQDTGIGIPPQAKDRVFERFYRVDKSHSRAIGGTGLGLSIVKHGAAFHNAQIELESELNVGTTIRLIFPQ